MAKHGIELDRGLPANVDVERFVLGSVLLARAAMDKARPILEPSHFALETHQLLYRRMCDIHDASGLVDRMTLANELVRHSELDRIGGLSYLVSLDDGLPSIPNIEGYLRIIRDKYALRMIITAAQQSMNRALMAEESPEQIVSAMDADIGNITSSLITAKTAYSFGDIVEEVGGIDGLLGPRKSGVPTGFPCLDSMCFGLEPGLLYVIGGDSSHGKSTFAGNIAANVALGNTGTESTGDMESIAIFNMEMTNKAVLRRMLCAKAKVSAWKLNKGYLSKEEKRALMFAASEFLRSPLLIDDCTGRSGRGEGDGGLGIRKFGSRVRTLVRDKKIKGAVLDYLQLLDWRRDGLKSEYEGVTFATWYCKQLAKELGIWILVLTQFNQEYSRRKDKSQRPTVDACHGSGSIKKDADVVWLLYRLSQAHPNNADMRKTVEIIVGKQRDGRVGTLLAEWERDQYRFEEKPESEQPGFGEDT